eukprot:4777422-Pleurochrysis_carterae.AAC.4
MRRCHGMLAFPTTKRALSACNICCYVVLSTCLALNTYGFPSVLAHFEAKSNFPNRAPFLVPSSPSAYVASIELCTQGGGILVYTGSLTLREGSVISKCRAAIGASVSPGFGSVTYISPTLAGHWLPTSPCRVYRRACSEALADSEANQACLRTREQCSVTADEWVN